MSGGTLLGRMREEIRRWNYSRRTEEAYVGWVRRFLRFHEMRHPREMGRDDVVAFLTYLATKRKVSASTQNQAASALLFLSAPFCGWTSRNPRASRALAARSACPPCSPQGKPFA